MASASEPPSAAAPPAADLPEPPAWALALFWGGLFGAVAALVAIYEVDLEAPRAASQPFFWTDRARDQLLAGVVGAGALLLGVEWWLRRRGAGATAQRGLRVVLATLTFGAGVVYFYANGARPTFPHVHDAYHYHLGAKYFEELGYDRLYLCTAAALPPRVIPDRTRARDLRNERFVRVSDLRAQDREAGPERDCRSRFSESRWEDFVADLQLYYRVNPRKLRGALDDRGYNGTPLQTFVAAHVATLWPRSYAAMSAAQLLDTFGLCAMLFALCRAFGVRTGLFVGLLYFSQFPDQFLYTGGSFLRFQWLVALGLGLSWLKSGRHASAGAALTVATFLNVFPALFCVPIALRIALSLARRRGLSRDDRRLLGGAAAAGVLCALLGAAHADGVRNYEDFAQAMRVHNAAGRAPGFGVGLKYHFLDSPFDRSDSGRRRQALLDARKPIIFTLGAAIFALALWAGQALSPPGAAMLAGFTGLFCIFGPTGYYYAFAPLLLLMWHRRGFDAGARATTLLLYLLSLPPYGAFLAGAHRFHVFNRWVSISWTLYLVAVLVVLIRWRLQARSIVGGAGLAADDASAQA